MRVPVSPWRGLCGSFLRSERGTSTIEFLFTVPVFMTIMLMSTDAATLYNRVSNFESVSRDTARIVARNGMTADEGIAYAKSRAGSASVTPNVSVLIANGFVTVTISADANALSTYKIIGFAVGDTVSAVAVNTMEPI